MVGPLQRRPEELPGTPGGGSTVGAPRAKPSLGRQAGGVGREGPETDWLGFYFALFTPAHRSAS